MQRGASGGELAVEHRLQLRQAEVVQVRGLERVLQLARYLVQPRAPGSVTRTQPDVLQNKCADCVDVI